MDDLKRMLELLRTDKTIEEQVVCRAAFHAILEGKPLDPVGLATATGYSQDRVQALLDGLTGRGLAVVESEESRVVGSWGLSTVRTAHRLRIRGREFHGWCALDAVGIPAALGENASVSSRCHRCECAVNIEMAAGRVTRLEPPDTMLWVAAGETGRSVVGFT
jgi:hypothetical protein